MNILKMIFSIAIVSALLCSCSKDDDYTPQVASAVSNSLYIYLLDESGKSMSNNELLTSGDVSVFEEVSNRYAKIDITDYEGTKMLRFSIDVPAQKSMTFNQDKTEGIGTVKLLMNIKDTKFPMSVNFVFTSSSNDATTLGTNSIRIKSIEYAGKTIIPTEKLNINLIKMKYNGTSTSIEPLM